MKLIKTEVGQRVFKDRSIPLTPRQRAAFILMDGQNTIDQVLAATQGVCVSREDIDYLLQFGLLEQPSALGRAAQPGAGAAPGHAPAVAAPSDRTAQERYQAGYPMPPSSRPVSACVACA